MAGIDTKGFEAPQTTAMERALMERIEVGGLPVWRYTFEPGWRFTEHADPEPCPAPHAAYVVSGRLHVVMDDGTEAEAGPGDVAVITPGHDAWTVGDEACVMIDFAEAVAWPT